MSVRRRVFYVLFPLALVLVEFRLWSGGSAGADTSCGDGFAVGYVDPSSPRCFAAGPGVLSLGEGVEGFVGYHDDVLTVPGSGGGVEFGPGLWVYLIDGGAARDIDLSALPSDAVVSLEAGAASTYTAAEAGSFPSWFADLGGVIGEPPTSTTTTEAATTTEPQTTTTVASGEDLVDAETLRAEGFNDSMGDALPWVTCGLLLAVVLAVAFTR